MSELDEIQARADAATARLAAWEDRPERVSIRIFPTNENGDIRTRQLHPSYESALLASAEHANETIPKILAALRAVGALCADPEHHETQGPHNGYVSVDSLRTAIREALG